MVKDVGFLKSISANKALNYTLKTCILPVLFCCLAHDANANDVQFVVKNDVIDCGEEFTVEMAVNNFQQIDGFQLTLEFDQSVLDFLSLNGNLPGDISYVINHSDGYITIIWVNAGGGLILPDGSVIIEFDFDHTGPCDEPFIVHIVDDPLFVEVTNSSLQVTSHLVFGGVMLPFENCGIEVDAGEDQFVCDPGDVIELMGSITGNYHDFFWEPENLVFNPESLTTSAEIPSTTSFVLTGRKETDNIIYNSHFDYGYAGFFSDYEYNEDDLSGGNIFTVASSPDVVYGTFPACSDHTGNNGKMLIVNGADAPAQNVWCQYVEVEENTTYLLEAFTHTLLWPSFIFPLPDLQFKINGDPVGGIYSPNDIPCFSDWTKMEGIWTSTDAGTIELCIYNHQGNVNPGNSFIIDDIAMIPLCEVKDTVEIELREPAEEWVEATICSNGGSVVIAGNEYTSAIQDLITIERQDDCDSLIHVEIFELELDAVIIPPNPITCSNDEMILSAEGSSSGPHIEYQWTTSNGNIVSGDGTVEITVGEPGIYTLTVLYDDGDLSCISEEVSVEVLEDIEVPDLEITGPDELNCGLQSITLTAETTPSGNYSYFWTTNDGNITSGNEDEIVDLDAAGTYIVEVTNLDNGCSVADTFAVSEDFESPLVNAGPDTIINCLDSIVTLQATVSPAGTSFETNWQSPNGNIIGDPGSSEVNVDEGGMYIFEATNPDNNCSAADTLFVFDEKIFPELSASPADMIDCNNDSVWIHIQILNDSLEYIIEWSTQNGDIAGVTDSTSAVVGSGGTYTAKVQFTATGCVTEIEIEVEENFEPPTANAGPDMTLTCQDSIITLDGSASSTGSDFDYSWTTTLGSILSGENSLNPEVDGEGIYILTVINNQNGCSSTDSVTVTPDFDSPEVVLSGDSVINCFNPPVDIGAQVLNDTAHTPLFNWTTNNGNITGNSDAPDVTVDQSGVYTLEVTFSENGCVSSAQFEIFSDTSSPEVDSIITQDLSCQLSEALIEVFTSPGQGSLYYEWTGPPGSNTTGVDSNVLIAEVVGEYTFTITNTENGCETSGSIEIEGEFTSPQVDLFSSGELTCAVTEIDIWADYGGQSGLVYAWSTNDGTISGPDNEDEITVTSPGTYQLISTNTQSGCSDTSAVSVTLNNTPPFAHAGEDVQWTCSDSLLVLDGSESDQGSDIEYEWTTTSGIISGPNDQDQVEITGPGMYILNVTNTGNGCSSSDTVNVIPDQDFPQIEPVGQLELNCDLTEGWIGFDLTGSTDVSINWESNNGVILSDTDSLWIQVGSPGQYTISVLSLDNNCETQQMLEVTADTIPPNVNAGPDPDWGCDTQEVLLDGSGSESGSDISYSWTALVGNITSGEDAQQATANEPGTYVLTVSNAENGCESTDTVTVNEIIEHPKFSIDGDSILNCENTEITLTAVMDPSPFTPVFEWLKVGTPTGQNSNSLEVTEGGTYELIVWFEENDCSTSQQINIQLDTVAPEITLNNPETRDCRNTSIEIGGRVSGTSASLSHQWTMPDGTVLPQSDELAAQTNQAGVHILESINQENGCIFTDSITVEIDTVSPEFTLETFPVAGCGDLTGAIFIEFADSDIDFEVVWVIPSGDTIGPLNETSLEIDRGDWFTATVTDLENGCSREKSIFQEWDLHSEPDAQAGPDAIFGCADSVLTLDGSGSTTGSVISHHWSTPDGNIISNPDDIQVQIGSPGMYILEVRNNAGNCSTYDTVNVSADENLPEIYIQSGDGLNCLENEVILDATESDSGPDMEWSWSGSAPFEELDPDGLIISVEQAGTFEFTLNNTVTGCKNTSSITVEENRTPPEADAGDDLITNCSDSMVHIGAELSNHHSNLIYEWSELEGEIFGDQNRDSIQVSATGTFVLTVTDTVNYCQSSDTISLMNTPDRPTADAGPGKTIDCLSSTVVLDGSGSDQGPDFEMVWTTEDGHIASGELSPFPEVTKAGTYQLIVTNLIDGCSSVDEVMVFSDSIVPEVIFGEKGEITCRDTLIELQVEISTSGENYQIQWQSENGNIASGENSPAIEVNRAGTYTIRVEDEENGCITVDSVEVKNLMETPEFQISGKVVIDCYGPAEIQLSTQSDFEISAADQNGNSLQLEITEPTLISEAGVYDIEVFNPANHCIADTTLEITENLASPGAIIDCIECDDCNSLPAILSSTESTSASGEIQTNWIFEEGAAQLMDSQTLEVLKPTEVKLVVLDPANGCADTSRKTFESEGLSFPEVEISHIDCNNEKGKITFNSPDTSLSFSINGGLDYSNSPEFTGLDQDTYQLKVKNRLLGCESDIRNVEVEDRRQDIVVELPDLVSLQEGESYTLRPGFEPPDVLIANYHWHPAEFLSCNDCPEPTIYELSQSTTFKLQVESEGGCTGSAEVYVELIKPESGVFLPTAFSPNGDGVNDLFIVFASSDIQSIESLRIFDRWGNRVFEKTNFPPGQEEFGWDGTFRGQDASPGVYAVTVSYEMPDGEIRHKAVEVNLLR